MGEDSVSSFLHYEGKWAIVLGLTSNRGASDFELQRMARGDSGPDNEYPGQDGEYLYEKVLRKVSEWGSPENLMFVVGATQADEFTNIRKITPDHFYLVPGVGEQGGSLREISEKAMTKDCGILVNASRSIIYAGEKEYFTEEARTIAQQYQKEMKEYLKVISALPYS